MSAIVASFRDVRPSRIRTQLLQSSVEPRPESILCDMADGNLATEFIFSFAGFTHAESNLVLTIIGIISDGQDGVELYDEDIAKVAQCDVRTVQRWRKAYLERAKFLSFWPLAIEQGEYVKRETRYLPTSYRVTFADTLEKIVSVARASSDYEKDRRGAIERTAGLYYEDIEQAPPKMRTRKPKRAKPTPLSHLEAASRKLATAQTALVEMPERQRNAYLNGQREDLELKLEALRAQMAEIESVLSGIPPTVENEAVEYIPDILSGIPPSVVEEEEECTTQHSPEAVAVFDGLLTRLRSPAVLRTEVVVVARAPDPDEVAEAEAVRAEACGEEVEE
jgi:hypothetical protein